IRDFHVTGVQTCALPISFHLLSTRPIVSLWDASGAKRPIVGRFSDQVSHSGTLGLWSTDSGQATVEAVTGAVASAQVSKSGKSSTWSFTICGCGQRGALPSIF